MTPGRDSRYLLLNRKSSLREDAFAKLIRRLALLRPERQRALGHEQDVAGHGDVPLIMLRSDDWRPSCRSKMKKV